MGFEPTPPERLEPKSSALDHSATLPMPQFSDIIHQIQNLNGVNVRSYEIVHILKWSYLFVHWKNDRWPPDGYVHDRTFRWACSKINSIWFGILDKRFNQKDDSNSRGDKTSIFRTSWNSFFPVHQIIVAVFQSLSSAKVKQTLWRHNFEPWPMTSLNLIADYHMLNLTETVF